MQRLLCHLASAQATAPLLFHHFTDGSDKEGWAQGQFQLPVGVIPSCCIKSRLEQMYPVHVVLDSRPGEVSAARQQLQEGGDLEHSFCGPQGRDRL